jgi:sugar phosphate isomerase/epimerase
LKKAKNSGYDGIEIWLPADPKKQEDNFNGIEKI